MPIYNAPPLAKIKGFQKFVRKNRAFNIKWILDFTITNRVLKFQVK